VAVTEWEPATEAEAAMRDALRGGDQEEYFRILARTELLLPVSADSISGQTPVGWGTWTTSGRTHVLAFTSGIALQACLAENAGSARRMAYPELAAAWPNLEWWLAVNPGLPIEGYLPAWFVTQLARGDVRLPGRSMAARARLEKAESAARARATAVVPGRIAPPGNEPTSPASGSAPTSPAGAGYGTASPGGLVGAGASGLTAAGPGGGLATPAQSGLAAAGPAGFTTAGPGGLGTAAPGGTEGADQGDPAGGGQSGLSGARQGGLSEAGGFGGVRDGGFGGSGAAGQGGFGSGEGGAAAGGFGPGGFGPGAGGQGGLGGGEGGAAAGGTGGFGPPGAGQRDADSSGPGQGGFSGATQSGLSGFGRGGSGQSGAGSSGFGPGPGQSGSGPGGAGQGGPSGLGQGGLSAAAQSGLGGTTPAGAPSAAGPTGLTTAGYASAPPEGQPSSPGYRDPAPSGPSSYGGPTGGPPPSAVSPLAAPPPPPIPDAPAGPSGGGSAGLPRRVAGSGPAIPLGPIGANLPPINSQPAQAASASPTSAPPAGAPPSNGTDATTGADAPRPWDTPPAPQAWDSTPTGTPTQPWEPTTTTTGTPTQPWGPTTTGTPTQPWEPTTTGTPTQPWEPTTTGAPTQPWEAPGAAAVAPAQRWAERREPPPPAHKPEPPPIDFTPANDVEKALLAAAAEGSTDTFLSTLLLAKVLLPVSPVSADGTRPGEPGFAWLTETLDSEPYVVVFTSIDRLRDHLGETIETIDVKFMQLIKAWPDEAWSFAVNPSTPVGAKLPGVQILALANWAADVGLGGDTEEIEPASRPVKKSVTPDPNQPTLMQKAVAPSQVDYYIERGYDRVSGFVHRANEVAHLNTPTKVYAALGLGYTGSAFKRDASEIYVLRWPAYRPSLYRIPYGGQNEPAMRAMEGWVIERAPFRGNGFAPSDSGDVIAEFKVDSARLPHGAQLWRITADGNEKLVALLDADAPTWRRVGDE
jgi:SseB protein N-terminal domain